MSLHCARIAIIGGGLSGLYAAYLLEQKGIRDYIVLEARTTLGGRILSETYPQVTAAAGAISSLGSTPLTRTLSSKLTPS